ncbi:MAG: hypothetical protein JXB42_04215 [Deltaproteobacteria bacterium]|nr:hypothetical protein [Deltaproteobacteria bacterium]
MSEKGVVRETSGLFISDKRKDLVDLEIDQKSDLAFLTHVRRMSLFTTNAVNQIRVFILFYLREI